MISVATNPDPYRISSAMWRLWEGASRILPGARLSGIYANKPHYHSSVNENKENWSDSYSIKLPLDLPGFNYRYARAIDLTLSEAEMIKLTTRMKNSALNPQDNRLAAVREFYGTLDGNTVYGLIKDDENGPWRRSSANNTHLWHEHESVFTKYVDNWDMLSPQLSVWVGQSWEEYKMGDFLPIYGASGEHVAYWQYVHNYTRTMVTPNLAELKADGDYGDATAAAFASMYKAVGGKADYNGKYLSAWTAVRYQQLLAKREAQMLPKPPVQSPSVDRELLKEIVNGWLFANIPDLLQVDGTFTGRVSLSDEPA